MTEQPEPNSVLNVWANVLGLTREDAAQLYHVAFTMIALGFMAMTITDIEREYRRAERLKRRRLKAAGIEAGDDPVVAV